MIIRLRSKRGDVKKVHKALLATLKNSRFLVRDIVVKEQTADRKRGVIHLNEIRLKEAKYFRGCAPEFEEWRLARPCKRAHFLEAADWIEWNDLLNDLLDELDCPADVLSRACVVRKGRLRRTRYDTLEDKYGIQSQWEKAGSKEAFSDCNQHPLHPYSEVDGSFAGIYRFNHNITTHESRPKLPRPRRSRHPRS